MIKKSKSLLKAMVIVFTLSLTSNLHSSHLLFSTKRNIPIAATIKNNPKRQLANGFIDKEFFVLGAFYLAMEIVKHTYEIYNSWYPVGLSRTIQRRFSI